MEKNNILFELIEGIQKDKFIKTSFFKINKMEILIKLL